MEFETLLTGTEVPTEVQEAVTQLLAKKRSSEEAGEGPINPVISKLIEAELKRYQEAGVSRQKPETKVEALSVIFQETLNEVWG